MDLGKANCSQRLIKRWDKIQTWEEFKRKQNQKTNAFTIRRREIKVNSGNKGTFNGLWGYLIWVKKSNIDEICNFRKRWCSAND